MKNGRNVRLTPSRALNASFARVRSRATLVTSTSTTVVSCACVCRASTMRSAMIWRSRLAFSVVPRSGDTAGTGAALVADEAGAAATGAGAAAWAAASAAAWRAASAFAAASSTSSLRMRPPTPVPASVDASTPFSAASLRTRGVR